MGKLIELGTCEKPHGIKGGFSFYLYNTQDSCLKKGVEVILIPKNSNSTLDDKGESFVVKDISFGNKVICYLENIDDRNTVESMIPFVISIPETTLPKLEEDEFYIKDLMGADVFDANSKEILGKIVDFYETPAQLVFTLEIKGKKMDLPYVKHFFSLIDPEKKAVYVHLPEDME